MCQFEYSGKGVGAFLSCYRPCVAAKCNAIIKLQKRVLLTVCKGHFAFGMNFRRTWVRCFEHWDHIAENNYRKQKMYGQMCKFCLLDLFYRRKDFKINVPLPALSV